MRKPFYKVEQIFKKSLNPIGDENPYPPAQLIGDDIKASILIHFEHTKPIDSINQTQVLLKLF